MELKHLNLLIITALALVLPLRAEEKKAEQSTDSVSPNVKKENVIVTANRNPTEIKEVGKTFTLITRKEIEQSNSHDLVDILRRVPGLNVAKNGRNGSTGIFIRGNESYYTKLLINGAPVEDASSTQVNFANIINNLNLDNVERIEIIRGPQSVLYGSDAIGGVINIITRRGQEGLLNGSIRQEFGQDKFNKTTFSLNGSDGGFNYSLSLSHESQNADSATNTDSPSWVHNADGDDYINRSGNYVFGYEANEFIRFDLSGSFFKTDSEYDSGSTPQEYYIQNSVVRPSITLTNLLNGRLETEFAFNHTDHRRTAKSGNDNFSETHKYEWKNTLELADWNTLTFGVDIIEQDVDSISSDKEKSHNRVRYNEFYLQEQLSFKERYFLTLGTRYSEHSAFGGNWSYQLAPAIHFDETGTKLHASYGTAYRAPSPYELFTPAIEYPGPYFFDGGNPNFQPEKSKSFDIGFDQDLLDGKLKFGATYFYVETKNKIAYVESVKWVRGAYEQLGFAKSYGVETYLQYQFTEDLFAKLVYTRTHTEYELEGTDVRSARVPRNAASFLINWQATEKLNLDGEVQYVGDRYSDTDNSTKLASYTLVNFSASYDILENVKVFVRLNNVLDEEYEEVYGFNTYGRSLYGGFEFKF